MQEVTTGMRENGVNSMELKGRMENKNNTLDTEICENIYTLYINKQFLVIFVIVIIIIIIIIIIT